MTSPLKLPMFPTTELLDQYRSVLGAWPVPFTEARVSTREGETFVIACGNEGAPPLVLLHGAQSNSASWMFEAPAWAGKFRVYAVDLVGEAGLSAAARPALNGEAYSQWLADVFDGLGIQQACVIGMSFGGWVALQFAIREPERVAKLALMCPAGIGRQRNFLLKAFPLLLMGRWGAAKVQRMIFGPSIGDMSVEAHPLFDLMARIRKTVRPRTASIPMLSDADLRRLRMPLQVIAGGKDPLINSMETLRRIQRLVPRADLVLVKDAHHYLPAQEGMVLRFLLRKSVA